MHIDVVPKDWMVASRRAMFADKMIGCADLGKSVRVTTPSYFCLGIVPSSGCTRYSETFTPSSKLAVS